MKVDNSVDKTSLLESKNKLIKYFSSFGFLILIIVGAYFIYSQYMLVRSLTFSSDLILNFSTYQELMEVPWWIAVFYASELGGTIGGILRSIGSCIALYSAWLLFRGKEKAYPQIRTKVAITLVLEASFFLFLIPTVILGFVYPMTYGNLWYFDVTPVPEVFFVAGVACFALATIIPIIIFKLTSKIMNKSSKKEIVRWGLIVGISYLFIVFWFDAFMQWIGMIVAFGINLLFDPLNLAGFVVSVFGLFLIASFALVVTLPFIKKEHNHLNVRHIGAIMFSFGSYFLFGILIYFLAGGFAERPFAWYEIIVPHNPYLWCVIFFFVGIPLMLKPKCSNTI